jgi:hypothetical protein
MTGEKIAELIQIHTRRYPEMEILDVYKLLHQSVFGPGHAIKNQKAAREWLERESQLFTPNPDEPLIENIHPDGQLVRVHLRPYMGLKGNLGKLLDGFIQSSKAINGDMAAMAALWTLFQGMVNPGGQFASRFDARTVSLEGRTHERERWPASHHSPPYERTYKPTYRVLTRPIAEDLLRGQKLKIEII